MKRPTCDEPEAILQAGDVAHTMLQKAVNSIDAVYGFGYAASHPDLVGLHLQAQMSFFNTVATVAAVYTVEEAIHRVEESSIRDEEVPQEDLGCCQAEELHEEHYSGRYDPSIGDMLGAPHTDYCKSIGKIHKGECPTSPL